MKASKHFKHNLRNGVRLAHPMAEKAICLLEDASDYHWRTLLTQIPAKDWKSEPSQGSHEF